jgi:hypothetical protein
MDAVRQPTTMAIALAEKLWLASQRQNRIWSIKGCLDWDIVHMPRRRTSQWAAQFAVASELCKRDYQVSLTLGNHPIIDLMVISPCGEQFLVDVKGLWKPAPWFVKRKPITRNLYYVLTYVPPGEPNQFFVMSQATANELIRDHPTASDIRWVAAEQHLNRWDVLPA